MKVEKASSPAKSGLKIQGLILVIFAALACGIMYGSFYFKDEIALRAGIDPAFNSLKSNIQGMQLTSEDLGAQIDATGKSLSGSFMSKDEFIAFLGSTSNRLGVQLNKYTGGDTSERDGISTMNFKFEVEGDITQLEDLVRNIDALGTPYAINSISLRKADTYIWLDRDINKTELLPWYDAKSLEVKKSYTEVEEPEPIGTLDIMGGQSLKLYLDLSFISSKSHSELDGTSGSGSALSEIPSYDKQIQGTPSVIGDVLDPATSSSLPASSDNTDLPSTPDTKDASSAPTDTQSTIDTPSTVDTPSGTSSDAAE